MAQSVIEALLKSKIGLDANSIGADAIASAISQRMLDCGIGDIASYLGKLQASSQEWEALIDSVIVPETWFFREPESFTFLKHYVLCEWLPKNPQGVLRVLSLPCSTGEEPYSIAIALLEVGLNPTNIHIDAVDISKKCLLKAQRAIYHQYSFRGNTQLFQHRYFQLTEAGYHLCEQVRQMVNFIQGNLLDNNLLADTLPYDVVFCRNLLIYFDRPNKTRTIKFLEKLLTPEGLLFVGHAETGLLLNSYFVSVRQPLAFAYHKPLASHPVKHADICLDNPVKNHLFERKLPLKNIILPQHTKSHISAQTTKINTKISTQNLSDNLLETAKILADRGCLDEAIKLCNSYLRQNRASIEAYVLLGQMQQAMAQNEQAAQSFQKAIYLQPTHEEALTHLALLREHQGNIASANLLWQRIHRLKNK
ncbi:chemotaxis protein [Nostoc linckia z18]|jgi:chemotaxis protein methyltransferase WspC|uniref:Chemotaxis protein n=2 Tax=Nostoc linckia TaxID=92942 RepID=A0A9Q6EL94_NOSLI|nr:protein-glutamate O-methyltransferase CheR [Nostoc linckia]PHK40032.1 chemotaxis protein [Nostoc linckia z15]PHK44792.1 chemotaxis protein [Nostoc linckia z16]PHJ62609.1 chemotaxis protein [Nostoc linckia z1]PHJ72045.1 chemotaxis protein [Nostoc linckia z3]PHJ78013.1 chemotaxis protein [Nostoc linckia z2]